MDGDELSQLRAEIEGIKRRLDSNDTQVDAVGQALEALRKSDKASKKASEAVEVSTLNRDQIDRLYWLFGRLERGVQAIACSLTGGVILVWVAVPMVNDTLPGNDDFAKALMVPAFTCIGYGLLVLTGNEKPVLKLLEKLPFLSRG